MVRHPRKIAPLAGKDHKSDEVSEPAGGRAQCVIESGLPVPEDQFEGHVDLHPGQPDGAPLQSQSDCFGSVP